MPQPTKGPRLGGGPAHERLLLANLAAALFTHKSIQTTQTKAKRLQPLAERLITFAKRGDLASRRRVLTTIHDKTVVHVLFTEIAPLVAEREGGYTRITKTGYRKGDNAPMAVIELVLEPVVKKPASSTKSAARAATPAKRRPEPVEGAEPVEETPVEETPVEETPVDEAEVVEDAAVADDAPVEEAPVAEAAADEATEEAPAEDAAAEAPAEDK